MKTTTHEPASRDLSVARQPILWLCFLAAIGLAGHAWRTLPMPFPACAFNALTGLPCPFCGGARSLRALASLQIGMALLLNPLICLVALWAALAAMYQASSLIRRQNHTPGFILLDLPHKGAICTGLVLANWLYLLTASLTGFWP